MEYALCERADAADPRRVLLILLAGVAAGALNAIGGGGSFASLAALIAAGVPPVTANATSTVALLPGSVASAWVYRNDLTSPERPTIPQLSVVSVLGGATGAALLLLLPSSSFDAAVPWLLAVATLVLAFGRRVATAIRLRTAGPRIVLTGQFVFAIYGGYFGGAVGLMMLAFWTITTRLDPARGNPLRVLQVAAVNITAAVIFLVAADVLAQGWRLTLLLTGAVLGGYLGAHFARRVPPIVLRTLVLTTSVALTVLMFLR